MPSLKRRRRKQQKTVRKGGAGDDEFDPELAQFSPITYMSSPSPSSSPSSAGFSTPAPLERSRTFSNTTSSTTFSEALTPAMQLTPQEQQAIDLIMSLPKMAEQKKDVETMQQINTLLTAILLQEEPQWRNPNPGETGLHVNAGTPLRPYDYYMQSEHDRRGIYTPSFASLMRQMNALVLQNENDMSLAYVLIGKKFGKFYCKSSAFGTKFSHFVLDLWKLKIFNHDVLLRKLQAVVMTCFDKIGNCDRDIPNRYSPQTAVTYLKSKLPKLATLSKYANNPQIWLFDEDVPLDELSPPEKEQLVSFQKAIATRAEVMVLYKMMEQQVTSPSEINAAAKLTPTWLSNPRIITFCNSLSNSLYNLTGVTEKIVAATKDMATAANPFESFLGLLGVKMGAALVGTVLGPATAFLMLYTMTALNAVYEKTGMKRNLQVNIEFYQTARKLERERQQFRKIDACNPADYESLFVSCNQIMLEYAAQAQTFQQDLLLLVTASTKLFGIICERQLDPAAPADDEGASSGSESTLFRQLDFDSPSATSSPSYLPPSPSPSSTPSYSPSYTPAPVMEEEIVMPTSTSSWEEMRAALRALASDEYEYSVNRSKIQTILALLAKKFGCPIRSFSNRVTLQPLMNATSFEEAKTRLCGSSMGGRRTRRRRIQQRQQRQQRQRRSHRSRKCHQ